MKPDSPGAERGKLKAGTLAFGIALLLRGDALWDGVPPDLPEPPPEPEPDRIAPAAALPLPGFGQPAAAQPPALRQALPSLSRTLLPPRRDQARANGRKLVKLRAQTGSALSGSFAGEPPQRLRIEQAAFPEPALSNPPAPAPVAPDLAGPAVADPAPAPLATQSQGEAQPPDPDQTQLPELAPAAVIAATPSASPSGAALPPPAPEASDGREPPGSLHLPTASEPQPAPAIAEAPPTGPDPAEAQQPEALPDRSAATQLALNDTTALAPVVASSTPAEPAAPAALAAPSARSPPLAPIFGAPAGGAAAAPADLIPHAPGTAEAVARQGSPRADSAALAVAPLPDPARTAGSVPPAGSGASPLALPAALPGALDASGQPSAPQLAPALNLQQLTGGAPPAISDDDELILELKLANGTVADTIVGYGTRNGVYVPLGTLARILDLAIVVSDDGHYASGWFLSEDRTLTIDLRQKRLELRGKPLPFPGAALVARNGEMYILADYLGELLPLTVRTDLREQSLTLTGREPFPFEERLAREERRSRLGNEKNASLAEVFAREKTDWRLIDFPLLDLELRGVSDSVLGDRGEADLRLSADLAYMSAQTYFSGSTRDGLTAARIELGRRDPDARLLGPLRASEFQIGDVSTQALPIGLRGTAGRGVFVTNASLNRASVFDKVDLRGELPDGYEVELYRNNVLIGSTRTPVNGRYEFLQVPVDFGLNVMRLVFYGPQGQRREEVRHIAVGDGRLAQGEFEYTFGMAQKDRNLLDVHGPFFRPMRDYGAWRTTGQLAYGFTKSLTGVVSVADFETDLGRRWQVGAGLRTGIGGFSARFDAALQNGDGKAIQLALGGRLLGAAATLAHGEYRGQFVDEVRAFDSDFLRRATEFNLNGSLGFSLGKAAGSIPYTLRLRRLEFADGRTQSEATLRGSARLGTMLVSNSLDYQRNTLPLGPDFEQLTGSFDLARLSGSRLDLRGGFGYRILPRFKPMSASLQADYAIDDRTLVNGSVGHSFDNGETFLGLSATRRFDRFTLGLDSNYSFPTRNYNIALRLGFSLGRHPQTGDLFFDQPGLATSGAVAIRAYHDKDGDDRFGPPDSPLEGITFFSGTESKTTDAAGLALIGELPSGSKASLQVDPDTIQDITLAPRARGFEVVPRPGRIHVRDFAIVEVSEVAGTALFGQADGNRPVSGLRLELLDPGGKIVAEARSESDGYFFFEQVAPGTYTVRIQPDQAARLGLAVKNSAPVAVTAGQPVAALELVVEKP